MVSMQLAWEGKSMTLFPYDATMKWGDWCKMKDNLR